VSDIITGSAAEQANIQKGLIIVSANDQKVNDLNDFQGIISQSGGSVQLGGVYPGRRGMYYYGLNNGSEDNY